MPDVRTAKPQPGGAAAGFSANDNTALDQFSLFLAGGVAGHFGAFVQSTYDGVAETFTGTTPTCAPSPASSSPAAAPCWASASTTPDSLGSFQHPGGVGLSLHHLEPCPFGARRPADRRLGAGKHRRHRLRLDKLVDLGGRRRLPEPGVNFLARGGADPFSPGAIRGTAPYVRAAWQQRLGDKAVEVGAFGFRADLFPGRDRSAGAADRYADTGLDASFQYSAGNGDVVTARWTHEAQALAASQAIGATASTS